MRRTRFVGRSLVHGLRWANGILGFAGNVVFLLGLLLGVAAVVRFHAPVWIAVLAVAVAVLLAFGEGAYREWDRADRAASQPAPGFPVSPNPPAMLFWNGVDYVPEAAKGFKGPKEFSGPVDPMSVSGVAWGDGDKWIKHALGTKFDI